MVRKRHLTDDEMMQMTFAKIKALHQAAVTMPLEMKLKRQAMQQERERIITKCKSYKSMTEGDKPLSTSRYR